jgi:ParB/RepB/Spo0J family partition protein
VRIDFDKTVMIKLADLTRSKLSLQLGRDRDLDGMVRSIKHHGVFRPIIVRLVEGQYEIVDGWRRVAAAKLVGLTEIKAYIADVATEWEAAQLYVSIDIQSDPPLSDLEMAEELAEHKAATGMSDQEIAAELDVDERWVSLRPALAEPSDIKAAFSMALEPVRHAAEKAEVLRSLKATPDLIKRTARYVVNGGPTIGEDEEGLTLHKTEYLVALVNEYYRWQGRKGVLRVLKTHLGELDWLKRKIETGQWGDGRDNKEAR